MATVKNLSAHGLLKILLFCALLESHHITATNLVRSIFDRVLNSGDNQRASSAQDVTCGSYSIEGNASYRIQSPLNSFGFPILSVYQCQWRFYGTNDCLPVINCPSFELAQSTNCSTSGLEVTDQLTKTQTFCGNVGPMNASTRAGSMIVSYKNSPQAAATPARGFSCLVTCAGPDTPVNELANSLPGPKRINCTCGVPGSSTTANPQRIVGGRDAPLLYWKWQASMVPKGQRSPFCGGSLINDRFILTAAHCIVTTGLVAAPAAADIVLNEYDLKNQTETITIRRSIISAIPHPFYQAIGQDYDYALLQFSPPVDLTATSEPYVTPVCLPPLSDRRSFAGDIGTATGFGTTSEGGNPSRILQEADIPIISNDECNEPQKYNGSITSRMICAGYPEGGIDACQGDSGGPFVFNNGGRYINVGVTSFGEGCARAQKPGVYSRVTEVNEWIRQLADSANQANWCNE